MPHETNRRGSGLALAGLVLVVILIAAVIHLDRKRAPRRGTAAPPGRLGGGRPGGPASAAAGRLRGARRPPASAAAGGLVGLGASADDLYADDTATPWDPQSGGVYASLSRLYSTADVDPLLTGQLYSWADNARDVYAERTSHGDVHGLTEYNSSGGPGDVGVDVGPYGLDEYGGKQIGYDDGIPAQWAMPSTPLRWYGPAKRDYFGPEGPTVYAEGISTLSEPDHDPLMN